jgi:hypothetical protein
MTTSTDRRFGVNSEVAIKAPCKAATTANITLSGEQTIDGVSVVTDDRVLVKNQTTSSENGIYIANTSSWARATDWDGSRDVKKGTLVFAHSGTANQGWWYVSTSDPIVPGTTSVTIAQASTALAVIAAFAQTLIDDTDADTFVQTLVSGLTAETTVATDDVLLFGDTSESKGNKITFQNFLKVINSLTEDASPDNVADFLLSYDASASLPKKVRPAILATIAANGTMLNGTLTASVSSNALTVALKTRAGTDPSASDPVYILFRNATAATGDYTIITVTAASSIVVSSTSTLGTASGTAHRLYVVGFNDAGTFRMGIYNPYNTTGPTLAALDDGQLYSSTAEGGAGAADSAQVIYTGTAVSSKALRVLGYVESTQATAGTWATTPSKVHILRPGDKRTGDVVQKVYTFDSAAATGTTTIPDDDTIPQITEGDQYLTRTITPTSTINQLIIEWGLSLANTAGVRLTIALFQDTTAGALAAIKHYLPANNVADFRTGMWAMLAGTTSLTTLRIRAGASVAGTTTFNGASGARLLGGAMASYLTVTEIQV